MPSRTVLSIGQCRPDHAAIQHFLTSRFDTQVLAADHADESLRILEQHSIDLVLINRKLDADYSDGMEILKAIKQNPATAHVPVMLVSNFPEWQEKAVNCGATYGFGKAELNSAEVTERLRGVLG
ncbi:MAG: response regulator [Planctomycetaceae bacterium]